MNNAIIVEDCKTTREWLCEVVRGAFGEIRIVEAKTQQEARRCLRGLPFDLALVDIHLPDGLGFDFLREFKHARPGAWAVIVTVFDDGEHIFAGLKAGADGYLVKDQSNSVLVEKLHGILRGEPPIAPGVARRILEHFHMGAKPSASTAVGAEPLAVLTNRESEILRLVASGQSNREIADQLDLKCTTVASYVKEIYRKLDISSRAQAALVARSRGLV